MSISSSVSPTLPVLVPDDPTPASSSSRSPSSNPGLPELSNAVPSTISISTAFQYDDADLIVLSSDSVFFSVHSRTIRAASPVLAQLIDALSASNPYPPNPNNSSAPPTPSDIEALFIAPPSPQSHSPTPPPAQQPAQKHSSQPVIMPLPETSDVLNVVLHLLYQLPCSHFYPNLQTLQGVLNSLQSYNIPLLPSSFLSHSVSSLIAPHASQDPLYTYALAASANLDPLAVLVSRFCLRTPLSDITEQLAQLMGPLYLRRLLFLHLGRVEAFKRILAPPPHMHPPTTQDCDVSDQKRITKAWALATAYLAWGAKADMSETEIREVLEPLKDKLECHTCKICLSDRIEQLCTDWRAIKDTI